MRIPDVLFLVQLSLFVSGIAFLRRSLLCYGALLANIVAIGLILNVFLLAYIPAILTDALSICLLPFVIGSLFRAARGGFRRSGLVWFCIGSLLVGILVVIRPTNIYVLLAWFAVGLVVALYGCSISRQKAAELFLIDLMSAAPPMAPQMFLNTTIGLASRRLWLRANRERPARLGAPSPKICERLGRHDRPNCDIPKPFFFECAANQSIL